MASLLTEIKTVKVAELKLLDKNPRVGDVDGIAESLKTNGQFLPLIVDGGTGEILSGNHTLKAAKKLRWKTIDVVYVTPRDDDHRKKIILAANRLSDKATYDADVLAEIINSLDEPDVGTGYATADVQSILAAVTERDSEAIHDLINNSAPRISFTDEEDDLSFDERMERRQETVEGSAVMDDELKGIYSGEGNELAELDSKQRIHVEVTARVEAILESFFPNPDKKGNPWDIPTLKMDMIPERLPEPIDTWAGQDTTPDDGKTHWILNWGSASSKGLPWDRAVLGFYSHDVRWDGFYDSTAHLLGRVVSEGIKTAIAPDNSITLGFPRFLQLEAMYRGAWLGRMLQEVGIKVIPNIKMVDPYTAKLAIMGIPVGTPTLAIGLQSMTESDMDKLAMHTLIKSVVEQLQPQQFIVYGGPPAKRCLEKARIPDSIEGRYIENFSAKRNAALKPWHEERKKMDGAVRARRKQLEQESAEEPVEA